MKQSTDDHIAEIKAFIEARLLGGREIAPDEDLLLSGQIDSLAVMSLVSEVERVSGHPVPAADVVIENFASIASIAAYLRARA